VDSWSFFKHILCRLLISALDIRHFLLFNILVANIMYTVCISNILAFNDCQQVCRLLQSCRYLLVRNRITLSCWNFAITVTSKLRPGECIFSIRSHITIRYRVNALIKWRYDRYHLMKLYVECVSQVLLVIRSWWLT